VRGIVSSVAKSGLDRHPLGSSFAHMDGSLATSIVEESI